MNVLVKDCVFDLALKHDGVKLADYCSLDSISDFIPIKGSFEELISDSFVCVDGGTQ